MRVIPGLQATKFPIDEQDIRGINHEMGIDHDNAGAQNGFRGRCANGGFPKLGSAQTNTRNETYIQGSIISHGGDVSQKSQRSRDGSTARNGVVNDQTHVSQPPSNELSDDKRISKGPLKGQGISVVRITMSTRTKEDAPP